MSDLELGIAFQGNKRPAAYTRLAQLAEELAFDVLSVYGDLFYQPSIYPLLLMARDTCSVRLGPACLNPFTLHPMEITGQATALDAASGGRAFLGLARGSWLDRLGMTPQHPLTALQEALEVIRRLMRRDASGYAGKIFNLEPEAALAYPPERPEIPIMVGTWSRGAARIAARLANEVKVGGSANPAMLRRMRGWLAEDLPRSGRTENEVGVVMGAVTVVSRDGREARRRAAQEVAMYLDVVLELDPTVQAPEGLLTLIRRYLKEGNVDAAGRLVPDDILDLFAFAGTPEQISRQVEDLATAGARRIEFGTPHGDPEEEGIQLLGEHVLPNFR